MYGVIFVGGDGGEYRIPSKDEQIWARKRQENHKYAKWVQYQHIIKNKSLRKRTKKRRRKANNKEKIKS